MTTAHAVQRPAQARTAAVTREVDQLAAAHAAVEAGHKAIRDAMGTQEGDQARLAAVRSAAFAARSAAWDRLAAVMPLSENSNYWRACRMAAASDLESSRFYQHGAKEAGR